MTIQWEVRFCKECSCAFDAPVPAYQRRGPQLCDECRVENTKRNQRRQNHKRRKRIPA